MNCSVSWNPCRRAAQPGPIAGAPWRNFRRWSALCCSRGLRRVMRSPMTFSRPPGRCWLRHHVCGASMFARPLSRWLGLRGVHYAWVVMSIVFLTMLVSSAALGLPGAFLKPLSREFGWTTAQISSALAVRFMLYGLIGPFAAILMERCGLRRIVCMARILGAGGV